MRALQASAGASVSYDDWRGLANELCARQEAQSLLLQQVIDGLNNIMLRQPIDLSITVTTQPTILYRQGRRHARIWVTSSVVCNIDNTLGGFAQFTLQSGWNVLDVVDGARIQAQAGSFTALYEVTDFEPTGNQL